MSGSDSRRAAPEGDQPSVPSPKELDAAARELASGRFPAQPARKRRVPQRKGVPSIEELDAAADELRSGRLPVMTPEPRPQRRGGLAKKPPTAPPSIEDLDAGAAELHSDRLPRISPEEVLDPDELEDLP